LLNCPASNFAANSADSFFSTMKITLSGYYWSANAAKAIPSFWTMM
jgi:hypothetical protein